MINKPKNKHTNLKTKVKIILIFLGVLFFLNLFGQYFNLRLDLTKYHLYTLSNYTKSLLKSFDDIVSLQVYTSAKLPTQFSNINQQIQDLLDEVRTYSQGKIKIEYITPDPSRDEKKLQQLGIQKAQMNIVEKDKLQTANIKFSKKKQAISHIAASRRFALKYRIW